jgi:hypothetical protein
MFAKEQQNTTKCWNNKIMDKKTAGLSTRRDFKLLELLGN